MMPRGEFLPKGDGGGALPRLTTAGATGKPAEATPDPITLGGCLEKEPKAEEEEKQPEEFPNKSVLYAVDFGAGPHQADALFGAPD